MMGLSATGLRDALAAMRQSTLDAMIERGFRPEHQTSVLGLYEHKSTVDDPQAYQTPFSARDVARAGAQESFSERQAPPPPVDLSQGIDQADLGDIDRLAALLGEDRAAAGREALTANEGILIALALAASCESATGDRALNAFRAIQNPALFHLAISDNGQEDTVDQQAVRDAVHAVLRLATAGGIGPALVLKLGGIPLPDTPHERAFVRTIGLATECLDPYRLLDLPDLLSQAKHAIAAAGGYSSSPDSDEAFSQWVSGAFLVKRGCTADVARARLPAIALIACLRQLLNGEPTTSAIENAACNAVRNGLTSDLPGSALSYAEERTRKLGVWADRATQNRVLSLSKNPLRPLCNDGHLNVHLSIVTRQYHAAQAAADMSALYATLAATFSASGARADALAANVAAALLDHWSRRPILSMHFSTGITQEEQEEIASSALRASGLPTTPESCAPLMQWLQTVRLTPQFLHAAFSNLCSHASAAEISASHAPADLDARGEGRVRFSQLRTAAAAASAARGPTIAFSTATPAGSVPSTPHPTECSPRFQEVQRTLDELDEILERIAQLQQSRSPSAESLSSSAGSPGLQPTQELPHELRNALVTRLTELQSVIACAADASGRTPGPAAAKLDETFPDRRSRRSDPLGYLARIASTLQLGSSVTSSATNSTRWMFPLGLIHAAISILTASPVGPRGRIFREGGRDAVVDVGLRQNAAELYIGSGTVGRGGGTIGATGGIPVAAPAIGLGAGYEFGRDYRQRSATGVYLRLPRTGVVPGAAPGVAGDTIVAQRLSDLVMRLRELLSEPGDVTVLKLLAEFSEVSVNVIRGSDDQTENHPRIGVQAGSVGLTMGTGLLPVGLASLGFRAEQDRYERQQRNETGATPVRRQASGWSNTVSGTLSLGMPISGLPAAWQGASPVVKTGGMTGVNHVVHNGETTRNTFGTDDRLTTAAFRAAVNATEDEIAYGTGAADARKAALLRNRLQHGSPLSTSDITREHLNAQRDYVRNAMESIRPSPLVSHQVFSLTRDGVPRTLDELRTAEELAREVHGPKHMALEQWAAHQRDRVLESPESLYPAYLVGLATSFEERTLSVPYGPVDRRSGRVVSVTVTDVA